MWQFRLAVAVLLSRNLRRWMRGWCKQWRDGAGGTSRPANLYVSNGSDTTSAFTINSDGSLTAISDPLFLSADTALRRIPRQVPVQRRRTSPDNTTLNTDTVASAARWPWHLHSVTVRSQGRFPSIQRDCNLRHSIDAAQAIMDGRSFPSNPTEACNSWAAQSTNRRALALFRGRLQRLIPRVSTWANIDHFTVGSDAMLNFTGEQVQGSARAMC